MPTQSTQYGKAVEANAYRLRGGMTIVGTNTATSIVTDPMSISELAVRSKVFASQVQQPLTDAEIAGLANGGPEPTAGRSHSATYKPYSAGTFAYQAKGEYVIRSYSNKISGVESSVVRIPGTLGRRYSILPNNRLRGRILTARTWTKNGLGIVKYTHTYTDTIDMAYGISEGVFADNVDQAARPSRSVPGELVYVDSNPNSPLQDEYSARTGT